VKKLLQIKGVDVISKSQYRLKNIDISIYQGEKIALLGKSGSGKTSLISLANGSLLPSKGVVKWEGRDIKSLSQSKFKKIATLWQDLRLIEELNVAQNVNIGALGRKNLLWAIRNLMGVIDRENCIAHVKVAGLSEDALNSQVSKLSGGQRQRVAIARLLRQSAELILADEPFSGLDPSIAQKILRLFLYEKSNYPVHIPETYLISVHRPELIKHFSRVIGIQNGEISIDQPTEAIKSSDINGLYNV
tara:strand:+ start:4214 stop:4954 length:741 start_codon:yes stop_codon:yes gene_type:complete